MSQESLTLFPHANAFCCKDDAELALRFKTSCNFLSTTDFIAFWAYFQYKSVTEPICLVAAKMGLRVNHRNK